MLISQAPGEKPHYRPLFLGRSRWRKGALPLEINYMEINYILRLVLTAPGPGIDPWIGPGIDPRAGPGIHLRINPGIDLGAC